MTDLDKVACLIQLDGVSPSERFSVIWHCPICRRGRSAFFAELDQAHKWLEIVAADPYCEPCKKNREVIA